MKKPEANFISHVDKVQECSGWIKSSCKFKAPKGCRGITYSGGVLPPKFYWVFQPLSIVDNVTNEETEFDSLGDWFLQELYLVATDQKVVTDTGEKHPRVIIVRFNELLAQKKGVYEFLVRAGMKQGPGRDGKWPFELKSHVKEIGKDKGSVAARRSTVEQLYQLQTSGVDGVFPPRAFWELVVGDDPVKHEKWTHIYKVFHWDLVCPDDREDLEHYYAGPNSSFNWFKLEHVEC